LLYPQNVLFGDTLRLAGDEPATWHVDVAAVDGLAEARLVGRGGEVIATRELDGKEATLAFPLDAEIDGWVALEVEDADGDQAWSNPVWIKRQDSAAYLSAAGE